MDNSHNHPLPPGVGTWPLPPSSHPSQFQPSPHSYPPPYDTRPSYCNNHNTTSLFSAAQPNVPFPPAQIILGATTDAGNGQSDLKGHQTVHKVANHNDKQKQQASLQNMGKTYFQADVTLMH